jgi:hypothetical protein
MIKIIISVALAILFVGCTATTVHLNSIPSGASVLMYKAGKKLTTNSKIELDENYFKTSEGSKIKKSKQDVLGGDPTGIKEWIKYNPKYIISNKFENMGEKFDNFINSNYGGSHEWILVKKDGYRTKSIKLNIVKSTENTFTTILDKLDSSIEFNSTPQGALIVLSDGPLPPDWKREFKTPMKFKATTAEANNYTFGIKSIKYDGYISYKTNNFKNNILEPGKDKTINIKLNPIITTVRIMTEPEGAIVEDITQGGFGYLGESPIVRNLTWTDISNWAERKQVKRTSGDFESIELNLRISKPGYKDVIMQSLRIPIGEERIFKRGLKQLAKEVSFSSDPEGVHVYVNRVVIQELYDKQLGKVITKNVPFQKHMGTTPFTYNIDPSHPLKHGDTLIFKKSGYKDNSMFYAEGQDGFHIVLEPKVIKAR